MIKWLPVAVIQSILIAALGIRAFSPPPERPAGNCVLAVADLHGAPDVYSGDIQVRGVVAAVQEDRRVFGIMDAAEAEACGPKECAGCATAVIPVLWNGDMPETGDKVLVSGRIAPSDKGLVLAAVEVTKR